MWSGTIAHGISFKRNDQQILKLATNSKIEDHYFRCKSVNFQIGRDCQMFVLCFVYTKHQVFLHETLYNYVHVQCIEDVCTSMVMCQNHG